MFDIACDKIGIFIMLIKHNLVKGYILPVWKNCTGGRGINQNTVFLKSRE